VVDVLSGGATLRARTTLLASAATGIALGLGAVALVLTLQSQLTRAGDALAQARVRDMLAAAAAGQLASTLDDVPDDSLAQVVDRRGTVVASSVDLSGRPPLVLPSSETGLRVESIDAPDDDETKPYRVWVGQGPSPRGRVTVLFGTSLESVAEATHALREALLVGVPLLLLLLAASIWAVVGRALNRIDRITNAVDAINESQLHRRVPQAPVDDEVGRLAATMNRLLERLERSSLRQRAFVGDASHDLQSPLAALRAQLEVARAHPDEVDVATLVGELLVVDSEMEHLVRQLLYVAAQDDASQEPVHVPLDLDDIVLEEVARVRSTTARRVDTSGVSAAPVVGDASELRRLVRNLLENAVTHADTRVDVSLRTEDSDVVLDVVDDGPGVPVADRERIFDRFYRGDPARPRHAGSGLGLAIARGVARRHRGDLRLVDTSVGAHFQARLPPLTVAHVV
jgi:signal transduction histidine kinase